MLPPTSDNTSNTCEADNISSAKPELIPYDDVLEPFSPLIKYLEYEGKYEEIEMQQCTALTKKGIQCTRKAVQDSFCTQHKSLHKFPSTVEDKRQKRRDQNYTRDIYLC